MILTLANAARPLGCGAGAMPSRSRYRSPRRRRRHEIRTTWHLHHASTFFSLSFFFSANSHLLLTQLDELYDLAKVS